LVVVVVVVGGLILISIVAEQLQLQEVCKQAKMRECISIHIGQAGTYMF
jgi:hypothetical protein